jgi:hypothetical protein
MWLSSSSRKIELLTSGDAEDLNWLNCGLWFVVLVHWEGKGQDE